MAKDPITKLFEREDSYQTRTDIRDNNPILENIYNPRNDERLPQPQVRRPFFDTLVRPDYKSRN